MTLVSILSNYKTFLNQTHSQKSLSQSTLHSKDYHNLLHNAVENEIESNNVSSQNNSTKADLWRKMGEQLEIEKIPTHKISAIILEDIEDELYQQSSAELKDHISRKEFRWNNSHFFRVMSKLNYINPNMIRNGTVDPLGDQDNSSINTPNKDMTLLCYDIINVCRIMIEKSKECNPFTDTFGKKDMREFYKQQNTIITNCKNAIDNKTKVPKNTESFLLESLATVLGNTNKCAQVFMEYNFKMLQEQNKFLTLKQATKFQKGGKQSQLLIFKPISRDTAIFLDYTGIQCTCGSWMVRDFTCYTCDKRIIAQHVSKCNNCHIPLYKERLLHIVKTGKCKDCDGVVDLPEELIEYARS